MPAPHPERLAAVLLATGLAALLATGLAGCGSQDAQPGNAPRTGEELGLMTSLPLYWPLGAEMSDLAGGSAPVPWQRTVLEERYALVPLDTLSPIPGLTADDPDSDPLAGITRLAVIQPRGLAPADNVALDDWVRGGGRLLIVLDPVLTGDYDLPLGDPRRPSDTALIPPVLARWGLAIVFDEAQASARREVSLGKGAIALQLAGEVRLLKGAQQTCTRIAQGAGARCRIGKGHVTVLADAAVFEHSQAAKPADEAMLTLLAFAFADQ